MDPTPGADGYVELRRTWAAGDTVELDLPMPVRRVYSHANVSDNLGRVALMRGPLVYCVEAADQPGVDIANLVIPKDAELRARHRSDLLGGVTVLETTALAEGKTPVNVTAIPYYAWQNREKGAMSVWIRETAEP